MTYEQYGSGPWEVRIAGDDSGFGPQFIGRYRFATEAKANEFRSGNGGSKPRMTAGQLPNVHDAAAAHGSH